MLTTNTTKVKERSQKDVKLSMITTGETQPKGFKLKGKGKPKSNRIITTGNIEGYQKIRKQQLAKEKAAAKIRQKKLAEKGKVK